MKQIRTYFLRKIVREVIFINKAKNRRLRGVVLRFPQIFLPKSALPLAMTIALAPSTEQ